jgi:hypothetical protein
MSQQDFTMYESIGSRDPQFQHVYGCGILGYRKAFDTTWHNGLLQTNSAALVCKRAIPTERPPLDGEASANFCR